MLISESIEEYMLEQRCRGNRPRTLSYYDRILGWFLEFAGDIDVDLITVSLCRKFQLMLMDSDRSSISVQSYVRGFRAYIEWLFENEYIVEDICRKFKLPKASKKVIDILTDDELDRLFRTFDTTLFHGLRDYTMCLLMFDCGLRLNEVVSLELKHIHLQERYLIITGKGDKQRIVPFGEFTGKTLLAYLDSRKSWCPPISFCFVTIKGDPISDNTIKDLFRRLKFRSSIPRLYPHLLRHTFATKYLINGGDIYTLQRLLGHTSLEMVKRYLHLSNQLLVSAYTSPNDVLRNKKSPR